MSDQENQDQKPKTAKQVALWLQRGRMQLAKTEAQVKTGAPRPETVQMTAEIPAPRAAFQVKAPTKRSVAAFLWMPQIHLSLQAFTFPLALLVQTFAQILISTGLLRADHPARRYSDAKAYGITQLLEEARQSLPPLRTLWGNGTRILATRQYAIFASTIGVLVTGTLALFTMFTNVFFGFAKAWAQTAAPYSNAGDFSVAGDLGIGFINAIFDPTASSVTSSGLGDLFRIYSSAMLIFAGIILLWIIISAVAETARTGIPFGKQFNHVWAPIRLVVALGLLVPLGSGLNSGQHMVIYLTQWGSEQANDMWVTFAQRTAIDGSSAPSAGGGSGRQVPGALSAIPVTQDSFRQVSDQLFDVLLCKNIYNRMRDPDPRAGMDAMQVEQDIRGTSNDLKIVKLNGEPQTTNGSNYITRQAAWNVENQLNCGNANFTELRPGTTGSGIAGAVSSAGMLAAQSAELANYIADMDGLADQVAAAAVWAQDNGNDLYGYMEFDPVAFKTEYDARASSYAELRTNTIKVGLRDYNQLLGLNFQEEAERRGWISAPVWLNRIAEQNGRVLEAASIMPKVFSPGANLSSPVDGAPQEVNSNIKSAWNIAQSFMKEARLAGGVPPQKDPMESASALVTEIFGQILQPTANPLGSIGGYGREMMSKGIDINFNSGKMVEENGRLTPAACGDSFSCQKPTAAGDDLLSRLSAALIEDFGDNNPATFLYGGDRITADQAKRDQMENKFNSLPASVMRPVGTMMISFGFMAGYVLPLLPFFRFMLGVLGWILLLFEAVLAVPLLAISLLKTDGEGFMTQNFQTGVIMILALILRPMLMIFGLLLGLVAFNGIMNITNLSYLAAIGGVDGETDNSIISLSVYLIIYGILAYTLANSAFKAIDILPNQVMSWLGARLDQRVDDASVIHQQTSGMVQQLGMVSALGGTGTVPPSGAPRAPSAGEPGFIGPTQGGGGNTSGGTTPPRSM